MVINNSFCTLELNILVMAFFYILKMKDVKFDDFVTVNQLDTNTNKQLPTGIIY